MIYIANLQARVRIPQAAVRRLAKQILKAGDLSLAFVTDAAIRRLNRRFLRHDFATDVLAFRMDSGLLGEVVVSADTAVREARRRGIAVREELLRYVVHGILHLLGYDDHAPRDRARMWSRQERELRRALKSAPRKEGRGRPASPGRLG